MSNNPLISIIVPVYNAEKYLSRCVGSILEQTFKDFELILVDDGSSDNSGALCDKYALKDKRIRVISKENGGVSSARNMGLDIAKGKYVTFIDSDDWVDKNYLKALLEPMEKYDVQLVVGSFETRGSRCSVQGLESKLINFALLNEEERFIAYTKNLSGPCVKLFLLEVINKNDLRFPINIHYGEDSLFVKKYLRQCKSIYTIQDVIYFYNKFNEGSLTKKINVKRRDNILLVLEDFYNMLSELGFSKSFVDTEIASAAFERCCNYAVYVVSNASKQSALEEIDITLKAFEKYLSLDLKWSKKQDDLFKVRNAVLNGNSEEIYAFYYNLLNSNRIRKILSGIKWRVLNPILEKRRDGLNKYKYLDK